jgi:hypothetical protein
MALDKGLGVLERPKVNPDDKERIICTLIYKF